MANNDAVSQVVRPPVKSGIENLEIKSGKYSE
jgi:hypothetical protein